MGKDHDLIEAVRVQDQAALSKILHKVAKCGKNKLIGSNKKININFQDEDGMSAMHQAALMCSTRFMAALLEYGADASLRDHKGMVPLHYAAWQGKSEPVDILLRAGSPVDEQARNGDTPLHLACQHGHFDVVNLLLLHHSSPTVANVEHKTPLDLACEFGRYRVVDLLLRTNLCQLLLVDSPHDMTDNNKTTCLHLAAKNGHADVMRLLLQAGVNVNRTTMRGTCLHEASLCGKTEVVRLLLDCGVDVNKANSYDQTALDIVNKFTSTGAAKELKQLLKEASFAVQARAVKDYCDIYSPAALSFKEGDIIKVLEQRSDGLWKGYVVHDKMNKTGYFPSDYVVLVDNNAVAKQLAYQNSKKVQLPQVPDLISRNHGYGDHGQFASIGMDDNFPPPPSPLMAKSNLKEESQSNQTCLPPFPYHPGLVSQPQHINARVIINHVGEHDPLNSVGGDMRSSSPCKDSPTGSNRNSATSSDSGRGFSTGHLDPKNLHNYANVHINNQHRLSGQSYESGVSSRQSYHSNSSSSVGSLDRLEESGYSSQINVTELFNSGLADHEVMHAWLSDLHYEEYYNNFLHACYDMPTVSRMTPEDLTAIGITKPGHRKRLKAEIARLNIHDGIPDHKPNDLHEWLRLLSLDQYYETLWRQGYENIDSVTDITWEDLEEIGIKKLGHQKKIMLAIDRLKRIISGAKRLSTVDTRRGSVELLDPPTAANCRWSSEMLPSQTYGQMSSMPIMKPRKSSSGDSISTNSPDFKTIHRSFDSAGIPNDYHHSQNNHSGSYQPDVVAIQVKRSMSQSGSSGGHENYPVTYQSFQVSGTGHGTDFVDRDSTPTGEDFESMPRTLAVAPIAPKAIVKPKPVAKIVAKTKRSSRESSPDIIDIEKHEAEKNLDGLKSAPVSNFYSSDNGTLKRKKLLLISQSENIYEEPKVHSPKSPTSFNIPKLSMPHIYTSTAPTGPIYVQTHHDSVVSHNASPTGRTKKVPPPPPPKRTNSISSRNDVQTKPHEVKVLPTVSVAATVHNSAAKHTKNMDSQQQAFATCVQNLSEKFGSKRENKEEPDSPGSEEDFPPPPPPLAMDIITPKIHNYGIPSKMEKNSAPHEYSLASRLKRDNGSCEKSGNVESTFGVKLRKASPSRENTQKSHSVDDSHQSKTVEYNSQMTRSVDCESKLLNPKLKRPLGSELNSSTTSVDSNTLPFANENVGTIKQRSAQTKPSIVQVTEDYDGPRSVDLNSNVFMGQVQTMNANTMVQQFHPHSSQGVKPPVPLKKPIMVHNMATES
ncbi:hypothetical protein ScPMuIL_004237, partial [Solemya velum]